MQLKNIIILLYFFCFFLHSVYNVYINIIEAKIVDISSTVNFSSMPFPFQIQFEIESNLNTTKLHEMGFADEVWDFFAPLAEKHLKTFRNKNMSGQILIKSMTGLI